MWSEQRAVCPENEALAEYMRQWWIQKAGNEPKACTHNLENNFKRAFTIVCLHKTPITMLKEFKEIKGVGKSFVTEIRDFFNSNSADSEDDGLEKGGKKARGSRSYLPQKNSAAFALLISLYRGTATGNEFMRKQDLIDAAEASGLSRVPIGPELGRGKQKQFGSSSRDWYCGWNTMKTLMAHGLVCKTSNPAKYMLSDKGRQKALECLSRSGMLDSAPKVVNRDETSDSDEQDVEIFEVSGSPISSALKTKNGMKDNIYVDLLEKETVRRNSGDTSSSCRYVEGQQNLSSAIYQYGRTSFRATASPFTHASAGLSFSVFDVLRLPPLEEFQKFEDAYKVVLILDDREGFVMRKSSSRIKLIENICGKFKIEVEFKRLPVGDAIWIARHKQLSTEYVLDFIVERKKVEDLRSSIKDNRYRDQKLRLKRTGIKKIMYVVEGDPNTCEGADSIKTACFTTEILEGFDIQRTSGMADTLLRYGFLTLEITNYYKLIASADKCKSAGFCPKYTQFVKNCEDVDKITVSDVFATQLMQVPQVTEEVATTVLDCYPTLHSLASAYAVLDGDTLSQEELLMKKSLGAVNALASKNIFHFVWEA